MISCKSLELNSLYWVVKVVIRSITSDVKRQSIVCSEQQRAPSGMKMFFFRRIKYRSSEDSLCKPFSTVTRQMKHILQRSYYDPSIHGHDDTLIRWNRRYSHWSIISIRFHRIILQEKRSESIEQIMADRHRWKWGLCRCHSLSRPHLGLWDKTYVLENPDSYLSKHKSYCDMSHTASIQKQLVP